MLPSLHRLDVNQCTTLFSAFSALSVGALGDDDASQKRSRASPSPSPSRGSPVPDEIAGVILFLLAKRRDLGSVLFVQELLSLGVVARTGVGLMRAMVQHADATGLEEVQLLVRLDNAIAIAFYQQLGFVTLEETTRQAFEPVLATEMCMGVRLTTLTERVRSLDGNGALSYTTYRNKAAFVMSNMPRFKEAVDVLQRARHPQSEAARVLPGDKRVRYLVATVATDQTTLKAEPSEPEIAHGTSGAGGI